MPLRKLSSKAPSPANIGSFNPGISALKKGGTYTAGTPAISKRKQAG